MTLSEEARGRLADLVELQPTKNADLQERWGLDSGSEVHAYLESELDEYYYRDENSLICATPAAEAMFGEGDDTDGPRTVSVSALQRSILDELPGPEDNPQSVVATLHDLQDAGMADVEVGDVRSALHSLSDRGLVERVRKTVPTFRLAIERDGLDVEVEE